MKHEDFKSWIEKNCMYETFYEDSEGRIIMILTELDAWAMCNKFAETKEETKDEPVGWIDSKGHMICAKTDESCRPLYTTPQRTWVGLTKEEINQGLLRSFYVLEKARAWRDGVAWAIQQLKEKNNAV